MTKRRVCQYLGVKPTATGRIVVREDDANPCNVDIPMPPLPVSVLKSHNFHWPPHRSWVSRKHCEECVMYKERER